MGKRAQAALEFMVFFGFFAAVFLLISLTLFERQIDTLGFRKGELAKETCLSLQDEINEAVVLGDGYWDSVRIKAWEGETYKARIRGGSVGISVGEGEGAAYFACVISADKIGGLPSDSEGFVFDAQKIATVRNSAGVISIEQ